MTEIDYLREACRYAAQHSHDQDTQNGAVLATSRQTLYAANAAGAATAGATLYCPWFACTDCARAIVMAGISEVVGLITLRNATPGRWLLKVEMAEKILAEACVSQRLLADTVGVTIRFDGRDFSC